MGSAFMEWIENNYNAEAANLLKFHNCPDTLNDAILKVFNKLEGKPEQPGFKFRGYLFVTFRNIVYMSSKRKPAPAIPQAADTDEAERIAEARRRREDIGGQIFRWVEKTCEPIEAGLFRFYYESGKTYVQCAEITGFSKSYIHLKVTGVREKVRAEFWDRLKGKDF